MTIGGCSVDPLRWLPFHEPWSVSCCKLAVRVTSSSTTRTASIVRNSLALPRPLPRLSFVAVGRMVEKKAPHLTITAFARVVAECPEARLRVIGDGQLLGVCRDLAAALGVEHAVDVPRGTAS